MSPAQASTAFYTASSIVLAGLTLLAFHFVMDRTRANRCIAGFLACTVAAPLMWVAHVDIAIGMLAVGVFCAVPACVLAEDHDDDGPGGGEDPLDWDPDPGSEPDLWAEFERDFWSHVERTGRLVTA